jgi:hypothetical protein
MVNQHFNVARVPVCSGNGLSVASRVNIFGRILGEAALFKKFKQVEEIKMEKVD